VYPADADPQIPLIRTSLGFMGMTDVTYVYSSGLAMGPDAVAKAQAEADAAVAAIA
jgi:FMN-dependent NADH-azoreductase